MSENYCVEFLSAQALVELPLYPDTMFEEFCLELRVDLCLQVHEYPTPRFFTSIGTGDDDFAKSMVTAVESIIGTLPEVSALRGLRHGVQA